MKLLSFISLASSICLLFPSCVWAQSPVNLADSDNQFAVDLYSHLASNTGNVFFSPYSLFSALSMTYEGARGDTAQEMQSVLHLDPNARARRQEVSAFISQINAPDKPYTLSAANAIWGQKEYPFRDDYINLITSVYGAQARNLDFVSQPEACRVTINDWVSSKTNDRIQDLLPPGSIKPETRLVLTNAVYFKGKWEIPFNKSLTKPDTFWLTPAQPVQTDMMALEGKSFAYTGNDQVQILKLVYQGQNLSMLILLPRDRDIQAFEKTLSEPLLSQWQGNLVRQPVNVYLPKFKFDADYQMKGVLSDMGIKLAFDRHNADFSAMANLKPDEGLYINQVYHKAWIETNEEGTEAAAATGVGVFRAGAILIQSPPKEFRADHPFIFLIQDNASGHILFMGRVANPRLSPK